MTSSEEDKVTSGYEELRFRPRSGEYVKGVNRYRLLGDYYSLSLAWRGIVPGVRVSMAAKVYRKGVLEVGNGYLDGNGVSGEDGLVWLHDGLKKDDGKDIFVKLKDY